ncbi:Cellulose synthase-like protein G2 [Ananas comosus]|uniref:Cellulose synthase-like protein G2 n=1 Tax=Ananas comosus TaxID=4615 RepID=A0A199UZ12_ANACO|nr:Cellulose synthase-like protein G2 [Ananas comosus]
MYEDFKESVKKAKDKAIANGDFAKTARDRPPRIEVIKDEQEEEQDDQIPSLVYVAREKRKNYPHHFKAGALNVLLRVSSTISNSPYVLVLDCDMSANDALSLRQAMCFHLDPRLSPSLAFVQFPQKFHNISRNDIYCAELRSIFKILWKGCDGLRGPILSGTGFYIRRDALYGAKPTHTSTKEEFKSMEISELKQRFGTSNEFTASLREKSKSELSKRSGASYTVPQEAMLLASCAYESDTQWGEQVGFLYGSLVEDYFTGFHLHCRGWTSAYCDPPLRLAFLGNAPTNFHDTLMQHKRWMTGLLEVGVSKYCPLIFGMRISSWRSTLQSMCYAWLAFDALYAFPLLVYGIVPQLCFSKGVAVFPAASSSQFPIFAIVYASAMLQHLAEVIVSRRTLATWWNEQRFWMLIAVTSYLFACVNVFAKLIGVRAIDFDVTNKAVDESQIKMFDDGVFNFRGASVILLPATTLSLLNAGALARGGWRMVTESKFDELFGQLFLTCFVFAISYPVLEGIFVRRDAGRVPTRIAMWSIALSATLLYLLG